MPYEREESLSFSKLDVLIQSNNLEDNLRELNSLATEKKVQIAVDLVTTTETTQTKVDFFEKHKELFTSQENFSTNFLSILKKCWELKLMIGKSADTLSQNHGLYVSFSIEEDGITYLIYDAMATYLALQTELFPDDNIDKRGRETEERNRAKEIIGKIQRLFGHTKFPEALRMALLVRRELDYLIENPLRFFKSPEFNSPEGFSIDLLIRFKNLSQSKLRGKINNIADKLMGLPINDQKDSLAKLKLLGEQFSNIFNSSEEPVFKVLYERCRRLQALQILKQKLQGPAPHVAFTDVEFDPSLFHEFYKEIAEMLSPCDKIASKLALAPKEEHQIISERLEALASKTNDTDFLKQVSFHFRQIIEQGKANKVPAANNGPLLVPAEPNNSSSHQSESLINPASVSQTIFHAPSPPVHRDVPNILELGERESSDAHPPSEKDRACCCTIL